MTTHHPKTLADLSNPPPAYARFLLCPHRGGEGGADEAGGISQGEYPTNAANIQQKLIPQNLSKGVRQQPARPTIKR